MSVQVIASAPDAERGYWTEVLVDTVRGVAFGPVLHRREEDEEGLAEFVAWLRAKHLVPELEEAELMAEFSFWMAGADERKAPKFVTCTTCGTVTPDDDEHVAPSGNGLLCSCRRTLPFPE